ncbi:MAG: tRNA (adenosine(37)-N6)-threonylcarbamoyltransferase complex ATPase subunit type 1 TsaE [Erysipelotrichia bacterium]|nr:tRNA (adenosine(37)-N6)-threonylcarbamoyltransferase complex ATPase subunit type 1 TsaE [Erysipelotrichia bacterium]
MPNRATLTSQSPEQTLEIAASLARQFPHALVLLHGELGAGKTLFARGFAKGLNIECNVSSPSYTLMNEYKSGNQSLYHIDLYRINCFEEVIDIGLFDILNAGCPCLIEWAERVTELNKLPHLEVCITRSADDPDWQRQIAWELKESQI